MTLAEINELVSLFGKCGYCDQNKKRFRSLAMKFLRVVRKRLGIEANVRYNPAGIACSGDAVLHGARLYILLNMDICPWILYRSCEGRRDYTGGLNHQFHFQDLREHGLEGFLEALHRLNPEARVCA